MAWLMVEPVQRSGVPSLERLTATQARLEARVAGPLRTLDPSRELTTPLPGVHREALARVPPALAGELDRPLAAGLIALALAQLEAFPGNLFWDLDLVAADIVAQAATLAPGPAAVLVEDRFVRMVRLQTLYGRHTPINFSYVHDFIYGFDWAKWLAREPARQLDPPGPFSLVFLIYMEQRAHELIELIARDDAKYPSLPDDEARNPFPFSREPHDEVRLHRELARRDLIPVPAWDAAAVSLDWTTRWRIPFQERRVEVARELGLLQNSTSSE